MELNFMKSIQPHVFKAIQDLDIATLMNCTPDEIRPIIPCLVRMALISPLDTTKYCAEAKKDILTLLSGIDLVNFIVSLLSIEFHTLETDLKKEQQMRQKNGSACTESHLIQNNGNGIANDFEQSDSARRVRIVLAEILQMQVQITEYNLNKNSSTESSIKPSELFENDVYLEEITDVICISLAELPNLLNICDVVEPLLYVNKGAAIISWVVANMPDTLQEVVNSLVMNAERGEEGGVRGAALSVLCAACPAVAAAVRARAATACRLPALVLTLTLRYHQDDLVPFLSGLLLGTDQTTRTWFASFLRNSHKRGKGDGHAALTKLRQELLNRLKDASAGVDASALLRLYCAMRGIAGIKFQDEEVAGLLRLVTQKPPPTPAGVRFVSLSLCMIIACPSLLAFPEHEKKAIEWVQWLVKEEAYFERNLQLKHIEFLLRLMVTMLCWIQHTEIGFDTSKNNDIEIEDKERSCTPKKFEDKKLEELLDQDRCQTLTELGKTLQVDESTVSKHLKVLGMIQKQGHWLPYELKPRDVKRRFLTCELLHQQQKRKYFLHRIVTGNEKWIHYDNPQCRKLWGKPGHTSTLSAKPNIHGSKLLLCICNSGATASFGEMLLLVAIHFHSGQLAAVGELVCATLGMRVPVRPNSLARIKQAFTHEIFTEQVVTAHAVKVPVTVNLNSNVPGYLPVHCIHQLLKSRAFSKHKVPIKNWIYRQICNCTAPLHPVMPALVEVYVNSILTISSKAANEYVNKPITEEEIRRVFRNSIFGENFDVQKKPFSPIEMECDDNVIDIDIEKPTLASQLLLMYYLLLYEDVRLANTASLIASGRKVKSYSAAFLSELPIKYLLHLAQKDQMSYGGLFSPLLRLLATHFPQLSLVDDWMDDQVFGDDCRRKIKTNLSELSIIESFQNIEENPYKTGKALKAMLSRNPTEIWPFAKTFVHYIKSVLGENIPRHIQELYREVWLRLNTVLPRCLWVMTINALLDINGSSKNVTITQENILVDPLQVLRCDLRVFRCGPILKIVLRILEASLAASRSQLSRHLQDKPMLEKSGQLTSDAEREELKNALVAAQESAALQILLEACLETSEDQSKPELLWSLREIRNIICSFLHQIFISEPSLAKLVHFQGYPRELLSVTVQGIPSMHICLDFIPELLSQASLEKQIFAVDLVSYLSIQYAVPKAMSIARLCVNTLSTLLSVLSSDMRLELFHPVLKSLVRICVAFPPLVEDITSFLLQLARVCESQASLGYCWNDVNVSGEMAYVKSNVQPKTKVLMAEVMCRDIKITMSEIVEKGLLNDKIY
ncbi:Integrator complex subunit 2 [Eumeta japonica]|uniref:Integrator complex subunit 2 n=1 Tax=Eumeta variegata TaxID=151549 RepID=A0A4C2ADZ1_EUMVA|nr:Integrator complex subunit 2 [Eumeta japonica]